MSSIYEVLRLTHRAFHSTVSKQAELEWLGRQTEGTFLLFYQFLASAASIILVGREH